MSGTEPERQWTFAQTFYADFNATISELVSRLNALKSGHDATPATIQTITSDLSRLTKSLNDATGSLPSYDQRQCELQLKKLEKSLDEFRGASASVPTFSFKRKTAKTKPSAEGAPVVDLLPKSRAPLIDSTKTLAAFSHRYLTILDVRSPNSSGSAELSISDLDNCIVNLLPNDDDHTKISAFYIQRVSRSIILLPRIAGSIILHDLSECIIVVGCHQFRMHDSVAVDAYIECLSDPIIEHCSGIQFATYPSSLMGGTSLQDVRHLSVKDFSHILATPSPNWSLLMEERCEESWPVVALQDQTVQQEVERMLSASRSLERGM